MYNDPVQQYGHTFPQTGQNPLLARVQIPGESFTLPSAAAFYSEGVLDAVATKTGEVHVHPMTAIDELVLKSVDMIFSGRAVKEVFSRCIPAVLDAGRLSAKDVDFLLVALRKVSYGDKIDIQYNHGCQGEDSKTHQYETTLDGFLKGVVRINPTLVSAQYTMNLPNNQVVRFRPATYDDTIILYQQEQADARRQEAIDNGAQLPEEDPQVKLKRIFNAMATLIESVDGITDRKMIVEWLDAIPVTYLQVMSDHVQHKIADWGVEFKVQIQCKDCGEVIEVPTPLNPISFFI